MASLSWIAEQHPVKSISAPLFHSRRLEGQPQDLVFLVTVGQRVSTNAIVRAGGGSLPFYAADGLVVVDQKAGTRVGNKLDRIGRNQTVRTGVGDLDKVQF